MLQNVDCFDFPEIPEIPIEQKNPLKKADLSRIYLLINIFSVSQSDNQVEDFEINYSVFVFNEKI